MKISYKWLSSYINTSLSPDEISIILTGIGLEVEALEKVETIKGGLEGLVVGEVLTCERHPDADKLSVTTVDYGQGAVQIVCGAPNVAKGQKVIVATVGTTLYPTDEAEGFKIKKSKIRGIDSLGMLCAEDEIGLGESHDGIMVLSGDVKNGTPAKEHFGIEDDYIFEIGLTPNRIDAASHYGVARDLAAYLGVNEIKHELSLPSVNGFEQDCQCREIKVVVENSEAAPRYCGVTIKDVEVKPSPEWLQNRLRAIGLNPKNNIVDITNFILHELGQPLHAFDADKICGDRIIVKTVEEATLFTTLDSVERKLSSQDLMICNEKEPMCIAGVFGGMDSGVTEQTKNIFIESAYFNPVWVRKSAKRHGLNTDSSFRFERGTDPNILIYALKRAALLVKELAGGKISSPITDITEGDFTPYEFELSMNNARSVIGKDIDDENIKTILKSLEIEIASEAGDTLAVKVPRYRVDVTREIDVIEDILRIYGYNNIELPEMVQSSLPFVPSPNKDKIINKISDFLSSNSLTEIMSNSLTRSVYYEQTESYPAEKCVKILNPLSNDLNVMRQTLLFNAMEAIQLNTNRKNGNLKLYEFGNCYFFKNIEERTDALASYIEEFRLGIAITGEDIVASWNQKTQQSNFFTLKRIVEKLLSRFGIYMDGAVFSTLEKDTYKEAVSVKINGVSFIEMGIVSNKINKIFDIKNNVYFMEMNFTNFLKVIKNIKVSAVEISKFPEVKRDLALLVDAGVTFSTLRDIALKSEKKLLKNVSLFDVYEGNKLPQGKKSYALSFILEDTTKTLNDVIIDKTMNNLIRQFEIQAGAEIRR